jgi:hypothetical protein
MELPEPEDLPLPPPEVGEGPAMGPVAPEQLVPRTLKPQVSWVIRNFTSDFCASMTFLTGQGVMEDTDEAGTSAPVPPPPRKHTAYEDVPPPLPSRSSHVESAPPPPATARKKGGCALM